MGYIIGIDLGGMSAKAAIFDGEGRILAKSNIATNSADGFDGTGNLRSRWKSGKTVQSARN